MSAVITPRGDLVLVYHGPVSCVPRVVVVKLGEHAPCVCIDVMPTEGPFRVADGLSFWEATTGWANAQPLPAAEPMSSVARNGPGYDVIPPGRFDDGAPVDFTRVTTAHLAGQEPLPSAAPVLSPVGDRIRRQCEQGG